MLKTRYIRRDIETTPTVHIYIYRVKLNKRGKSISYKNNKTSRF